MGALTPLVKEARYYRLWSSCVLAYTLAGCVSAALVGLSLGVMGRSIFGGPRKSILYGVSLICLVLAAREIKLLRFPLPESKRQTEKTWVHTFGFVPASAMWGFHIGLGFGTRMTHGGFLGLCTLVVALADPLTGILLTTLYWLSRALPVWIAPMIWPTRSLSGSAAIDSQAWAAIDSGLNRRLYRRAVAVALVWLAAVSIMLAPQADLTAEAELVAWLLRT